MFPARCSLKAEFRWGHTFKPQISKKRLLVFVSTQLDIDGNSAAERPFRRFCSCRISPSFSYGQPALVENEGVSANG